LGRQGWLAIVGLALLVALVIWKWRASAPGPALDCPPEQVRWEGEGAARIARCAPGGKGTVPQQLTVGQRVNLNASSEAELAQLPGVGPSLAHALVRARGPAGFSSWDDLARVPGVGPAKLQQLEQVGTLGPAR
jgi:competence protein ComEA